MRVHELDPEGLARLARAVQYGNPHDHVPWDEDAPVYDDLHEGRLLGYRTERLSVYNTTRIRYLAALFPTAPVTQLPRLISAVLGVQGDHSWEADIRLILQGRNPGDPSKKWLRAAPIERYQVAGMCLMRGDRYRHAAKVCGLGEDTVQAIDHYLGLKSRRLKVIQDRAIDAARDGVSIRQFRDREGTSHTLAQKAMCRARQVLRELGELAEGEYRIEKEEAA